MANVFETSQFKAGLKVMIDNDPCSIITNEFVKPGKGQAFSRVKLRNLKTGRMVERTFKSGETLPGADVMDMETQYLYSDGTLWYFMNPETYEQYTADELAMADAKSWLKGQETCILTLWNGAILSVLPPVSVVLKVTDTDPGLKGDTSSGGSKFATLETGVTVKVPLFVQIDELIKVNTRTGEYVARAKE